MSELLARWSMGLGIAGTLFFAWSIAENPTALALSEKEVLKKLDPVPVFTIADEQGVLLVASGVFISQEATDQYTIAQLNQMTQSEFTEALGEIWEETPEIAQQTWRSKPFADLEALHQAMAAVVNSMSESEQLELIRAHPDLGSKAKMAEASVQEQAGAGLDRLSESEYQRFQSLNQAYKDRFNFPFIIAVKNHTKESILEAFETRLENTQEQEKQRALTEISKIARFRLQSIIEAG